MDRGARQTTVHGVAKSWTLLSDLLLTFVTLQAESLKTLLTISKEIKPVNPKINQSWIFFGRTDAETEAPILWSSDAKSWLVRKTPDAERLKAGGEGDERRMRWLVVSPTSWTQVWASSRSWWWTEKPGVLQSMGLQRVRHDWVTELNWRTVRSLLSESSLKVNFIWCLYIYISYLGDFTQTNKSIFLAYLKRIRRSGNPWPKFF